ncbi:MAG: GDYXXLXY domain-containing protein [Gammaproteobacteria bacterium]|nr:GDYXXLXY domain-containing protein [Pseudomonadales bacterium]
MSSTEPELAREIWERLQANRLVDGPMPEASEGHSPWYIRTISGIAGWLASLFLFGFFAMALSDLWSSSENVLISVVGFLLLGIAFTIFRQVRDNEFLQQLALACSLCGQLLLAINWLDDGGTGFQPLLALTVLQAALAAVVPNFLHRVICSWLAAVALFFALAALGYAQVSAVVVLVGFAAIWLSERNWGHARRKDRHLFEAIGLGLALALVHLNGHLLYIDDLLFWHGTASGQWVTVLNSGGLLLVYGLFVKHLFDEQLFVPGRQGLIWCGLASLAFLAVVLLVPSGAVAVLILLIGFATQRNFLLAIGIAALLTFLSWYYYHLDQTLLFKSLVLMGTGILLLCTYLIRNRLSPPYAQTEEELNSAPLLPTAGAAVQRLNRWSVLVTCVLILLACNYSIVSKEQILERGRTVYLELAPRDPRSLLQGDYMSLFFQLARDIGNSGMVSRPENGLVVVALDDRGIGSFQDFYTGQTLPDNQLVMQYRIRDGLVKFATNAFFFQEGQVSKYNAAKYGEFRVDGQGELLLVAHRDEDLNTL